jgi:hypothetical protein
MPEPLLVTNSDKSMSFQYRTGIAGNIIQLMIRFDIKKPIFVQTEYNELKMLFNVVVQKEQENIVLKKKD